jgi:hypothetical protein
MSHDERRFDPKHQHHLLNSERQAHWNPPRFLSRFGLQPDAESDQGPPRAHRLTPEQVIAWLRAAGLEAHETWHDADAYLVEVSE